MISPVNNQCLIEVLDDYAGLSHSGGDGQKGIVRAVGFSKHHMTASTGYTVYHADEAELMVNSWIGKTVRYALYADSDSSRFSEDGTDYVLVPWYRILGVESGK